MSKKAIFSQTSLGIATELPINVMALLSKHRGNRTLSGRKEIER